MARIGVVHVPLSRSLGGAEKLCIETISALKEASHQVDLIVASKTNKRKVKEVFGVCVDFDKEIIVPPYVSLSTKYSRFVNWLFRDAIAVHYLKRNYDLVITTQPFLPVTFSDVMYMNDFLDFPRTLELNYPKYRRGFWKFYKIPYETAIDVFVKLFNSLEFKPLALTNSRFSKQWIEKYLNVKPLVVYPPVAVETYLPLSKNQDRENIVLTISRLEEGKGLDFIPHVAARTRNAKFVIIGSLASERYFLRLRQTIKNLGVEDRIQIIPNASQKVKESLLSRAKIYLHPRKYEYFGIAVIEAMAAGLIPLVHKSGGPWIDILNQEEGVYGHSYEDTSSCVNHVNRIIEDYSKLEIVHTTVERSKLFTSKTYRRIINSIVHQLLQVI
jgi:glycosyltransferase involved in cell wall biosynthesis